MLLNCTAYRNGQKIADLEIDQISGYLARKDCLVWVALADASEAELATMQSEFGLHELAIEDASHGHQRPKVEEYGDTLFVVLHTVQLNAVDELTIGELDIFVGANFVLSVRKLSPQPLSAVRQRAEREPHLLRHGSGYVLYALMDAVVDRYFPIIDLLETELEEVEARIFTTTAARGNIRRLYALRQRILTVRHAVAPLMDASAKLWSGRVPEVCAPNREYFRDVHDHLVRMNDTLNTLRESIGTAIQANLSMATIEESETTKRLAAWAGIFAVVTAIAGIWGMNFEHMPELKWAYGYPLALATIAAAGSLLYYRFRRAGWL